jgi:hypothetical protein
MASPVQERMRGRMAPATKSKMHSSVTMTTSRHQEDRFARRTPYGDPSPLGIPQNCGAVRRDGAESLGFVGGSCGRKRRQTLFLSQSARNEGILAKFEPTSPPPTGDVRRGLDHGGLGNQPREWGTRHVFGTGIGIGRRSMAQDQAEPSCRG